MTDDQGEESRDSTSTHQPALGVFSRLPEGAFHARLAATRGVAVVLFTAPHCGSCRSWKVLLPNALAGIAEHFFEVDVAEATGVARCFDIFHLPAVYLYRDGVFHAELQCEARTQVIRENALDALHAPAAEEP